MTTPQTSLGKVLVIIYGFFGCSCSILFFNLFLERILTALGYGVRFLHTRVLRQNDANSENSPQCRNVHLWDSSSNVAEWTPSIYHFWACLIIISASIICLAACLYHYVEEWSYMEAVYFCFVSFATIGFGDYISSQQNSDISMYVIYRIINFFVLFTGCCCIYSLFNMTSIVIRNFLSKIIYHFSICRCSVSNCLKHSSGPQQGLGLRASDKNRNNTLTYANEDDHAIMTFKEFLEKNQEEVLMMQKWLICPRESERKYSTATVGPMAIVNSKLGEP